MNSVRPPGPVPPPPGAPSPLREALAQATTDAAQAAAYLALARHYRSLSVVTALPLAQAALEAALRAEAADVTVEALSVLSFIEATQGQQARAFEHLALALDLAREHGLGQLEARIYNNRAVARATVGDLAGARRDLLEAQALAQALGDALDLAHAHGNLAYLANLTGQCEEALHRLNLLEEDLAALPAEEQTRLRAYLHENRAHTYLNLARQARERGRAEAEEQARAQAERAIRAAREILAGQPDTLLALLLDAHAAQLALLEGELERAHFLAASALAHHSQVGQRAYLDAQLTMAEVCAARGETQQAHTQYRAALESARSQGRHRETQTILQDIARLHEQSGDLAAALDRYREALEDAQDALEQLTRIEQRSEDLARELRQARAEARSWRDSVRRAEAQARHDPLTGLLNRRGMRDALAELEGTEPLLLALLDIDHFKRVNDEHSHMVGDTALRAVAARLSARAPARSLLARYGGEEFLLLLPDADPGEAPGVVEALRRAVEMHAWSSLPPGITLTVSAGYAWADSTHEKDLLAALEQADEQLYQAKRAGRNRVYPPPRVPA